MALQHISRYVVKRRMIFAIFILICAFTPTSSTPPPQAQAANRPELAAVLSITYPNVQLRRVNTEAWFSLARNAVAPFGTGDTLRTDAKGRAYLEFSGAFGLILMPNSTLTILSYEQNADARITISLQLDGHALQKTLKPEALADLDYRLSVGDAALSGVLTITRPADLFAVWSLFEGTPILVVSEGRAEFSASIGRGQDKPDTLHAQAGQGAFFEAGVLQVVVFDAPYSAARLIGQELGCPGTVEIILNSLNLRVGPGTGYSIIGYTFDDSPIRIMGIDESGRWYRVQQFSGFAWGEALAIRNECQALPVLPRKSVEANYETFEVRPFELAFLTPFYDAPPENLWFYRGVLTE